MRVMVPEKTLEALLEAVLLVVNVRVLPLVGSGSVASLAYALPPIEIFSDPDLGV